jgi:probable HAF family extracellular repeat protein
MNKSEFDGSLGDRRGEDGAPLRFATVGNWVVGLSLALGCQCVLAQATYRIEPLGELDGCTSYAAVAAGLNDAGQIAGSACTPTSSDHAFLWKNDGSPMMDLTPAHPASSSHAQALNKSGLVTGEDSSAGAFVAGHGTLTMIPDGLGGNTVIPWAINGRGQVTGFAYTAGDSDVHAFLWKNDGTPMLDLGSLGDGDSNGNSINASGQVVGAASVPGFQHAFVWKNDGTPMQDLGTLGGGSSEALFINTSGQIAGDSDIFVNKHFQTHTVLWKNEGTSMQDLGTLGGTYSSPTALNDAGQVAGNSYTRASGRKNPHAFVWLNDGTPMKDLGTLGGRNSRANDMNSSGQVTGNSHLADNRKQHAFLWRNDGTKIQDLNSLINPTDPLKPYVTLINGDFINNRSDIVADGTDSRTGLQGLYLLHLRSR